MTLKIADENHIPNNGFWLMPPTLTRLILFDNYCQVQYFEEIPHSCSSHYAVVLIQQYINKLLIMNG